MRGGREGGVGQRSAPSCQSQPMKRTNDNSKSANDQTNEKWSIN